MAAISPKQHAAKAAVDAGAEIEKAPGSPFWSAVWELDYGFPWVDNEIFFSAHGGPISGLCSNWKSHHCKDQGKKTNLMIDVYNKFWISNIPLCRMILLMWAIHAQLGTWTLEQPASSIIFRHKRFQQFLKYFRASSLWWFLEDVYFFYTSLSA